MLGPVQVLVLSVADAERGDEFVEIVRDLDAEGPVRLLDAFVVTTGADGTVEVPGDEGSELPPSASLFLRPEDAGTGEAPEGSDAWHLGEVVEAGSVAVVALLEHGWAASLGEALLAGGGSVSFETWLDPDDRDALEALLAGRD